MGVSLLAVVAPARPSNVAGGAGIRAWQPSTAAQAPKVRRRVGVTPTLPKALPRRVPMLELRRDRAGLLRVDAKTLLAFWQVVNKAEPPQVVRQATVTAQAAPQSRLAEKAVCEAGLLVGVDKERVS